MRVPLMPLALSLAVGGLLYAAYQGNKRLVEAAASRPAVASPGSRQAVPPFPESSAATPQSEEEDPDILQLDERCAAIAEVAAASVEAVGSDVPIEEFVRRPMIAFVNDIALRSELERVARGLYERPSPSVPAARREALLRARCL